MDNALLLFRLRKERELVLKANADLSYSLGIYFGYPKCCINEFCHEIINDKDPSERNIDGSGFIPCRTHFIQIQLGEIQLGDLIKNRICQEPFLLPDKAEEHGQK